MLCSSLIAERDALSSAAPSPEIARKAQTDAEDLDAATQRMRQTLQAMSENNPEELKKKKCLLEQILDEANRFADNACICRDWVVQKKRGEVIFKLIN